MRQRGDVLPRNRDNFSPVGVLRVTLKALGVRWVRPGLWGTAARWWPCRGLLLEREESLIRVGFIMILSFDVDVNESICGEAFDACGTRVVKSDPNHVMMYVRTLPKGHNGTCEGAKR